MRFRMLRPVGNRIPTPGKAEEGDYPWVSYCTELLDSGTSALYLAFLAASRMGDEISSPEVILPAYCCPDLIAAAVAAGVKPVLADLAYESPWMDEHQVREMITERTVAIVAVNFLGKRAPLAGLRQLADNHGLLLIEDSAQAIPPSSTNTPLADFVVLSFGRGKPVNLMGGGALLYPESYRHVLILLIAPLPERQVVCNLPWHLKRLFFHMLMSRLLYGMMLRIPMLRLGETRYHPLQQTARLSLPKSLILRGIEAFLCSEATIKSYITSLHFLTDSGWKVLSDMEDVHAAANCGLAEQALRFGMLAPSKNDRNAVIEALNKRGFAVNALYESSLADMSDVKAFLSQPPEDFPNARDFSERLITLPSHNDVTRVDIQTMAQVLK